jgi:cytolysin (calcineurin-like family phosphatase)
VKKSLKIVSVQTGPMFYLSTQFGFLVSHLIYVKVRFFQAVSGKSQKLWLPVPKEWKAKQN